MSRFMLLAIVVLALAAGYGLGLLHGETRCDARVKASHHFWVLSLDRLFKSEELHEPGDALEQAVRTRVTSEGRVVVESKPRVDAPWHEFFSLRLLGE